MISKRLLAIAKMVPNESNVIDIGCDHALLDIYLTRNNDNKCIAADISEKVIEKANANIEKYNLKDKIKTIVSNGIQNIPIENDSVIVISGMGAFTIIDIVSNIDMDKVRKLIVQSNNDLPILRSRITRLGYQIIKEKIICDNKKYYTIIDFEVGNKKYNKNNLLYGVNIIKDNDYYEYLNYLIEKNKEIIKKLDIRHIKKKYLLRKQNYILRKKLN